MAINIDLEKYNKYKEVQFGEHVLSLRPMSSAEQMELFKLNKKVNDASNDENDLEASMDNVRNIFFGLFKNEQKDKALEILGELPVETLYLIYGDVMKAVAKE